MVKSIVIAAVAALAAHAEYLPLAETKPEIALDGDAKVEIVPSGEHSAGERRTSGLGGKSASVGPGIDRLRRGVLYFAA